MDDAVMRYSDLIAPDNSIDSLIDLLGKVQSEYSELAQLAKRYAANMATDMRKVNTTTKAGRDELARLTAQADMAANAVKSIEAMYAGVNDELNNINSRTSPVIHSTAALIEQIQKYQRVAMGLRNIRELYEPSITFGAIDDSFLQSIKDVDSIMASISERANRIQQALIEVARTQEVLNFDAAGKAASDSLTSLRLALKDITASYEDLEAMERGSERGQATKNNLDTLRDAVTRLEAEIEPLVNKTLELIKAQQGLDLATSDEGKQIVALKQKIAELNKEMAQRAIIAEEVSDSEKALKAQLALAQTEWSKLSEVEQNSATGQALQARIKNLKTLLAEMAAKIKPAKVELTALEQATQVLAKAQKALEAALTDEGKAAIATRQELAELNKETRLQNIEATAEKGSYDQLKAQLQQAVISYRALSETERDTTKAGQALANQIANLRAQLKALDSRTKAATASMSQDRLETMQAADVTEKLAKAKAKLEVTRSAEYKELIKTNIAQREANREARLRAQLAESEVGSYNNMAAQYELNKIELKKLALANRELTEEEKKRVAETYTLRNEMKKFQEMTGVHTLSVGDYGKVWDSFGYSIQQIVREMPAAAMGINNLFIAVSNNIPIFVDELMKLRKENAALIAQNRQDEVVNIGKRIASSIFSWQTALMALLTVLTMYGDEITKWIGNLFKGEAAVISMRKAIRNLNKELENSNDSYGDNRASFKKLQNQWSELTTEVEKTEWIKNHEEAFKDLGLAIEDVNSAERILVQEADTVEETFRRRAEAAAATALATKEYEKALVASANAERARAEKAEKAAKRYEKRTGKSTVTEYRQNESGESIPVTMDVYDYFYEAYGEDTSTLNRKINRLKSEAKAAEETAEQYLKLASVYDDLQDKDESSGGSEGRDLTDRIYKARLEARKKYEKAQTALIKDEYDRREEELRDAAEAEIEAQKEVRRKAIEWRDDPENNYKDLTADEQKAVQEIISKSAGIIVNTEKKLNEDLAQLAIDRQIAELKLEEETLKLRLDAVEEGSMAEISLRTRLLRVQGDIEVAENRKTIKTIKEDNAKAAREADEAFIQQLKKRESFSATTYKDAGGHKTIGHGFTKYTLGREIADDEVITEEEADVILRDIIKNKFEPELNNLLDQYQLVLNQAQYNELLDLSYQGIGSVKRIIEDALDDDEGLEHIRQVYADVGATVGADAAKRFGESFEQEYLNANLIERIGLLLQAENLYTGGVIGGKDEKTGETGVWYEGMQKRSDSRSERFMAESAPELLEENKQLEENIIAKWDKKIADYTAKWQIADLERRKEFIELQLEAVKKGSDDEYKLRKKLLEKQRKLEIEQNKLLDSELQQEEIDINAKYDKQSTDLDNDWAIQQQEFVIEGVELRLQAVREGSAEELKLQKELLDEQLKLELKQNELLADNLKKQEDDIKASYARREKLLQGEYMLNAFQEGQSATRARYIADDKAGNTGIKSKQLNDYYLGIFDLEQEIALLEEQIWMAGQGFFEWSPEQIAEAEANVKKLNKDLDETKDIWNLIGEKGIGAGILTKLGYDDDQIDALSSATNIVIEQIGAIMDAEIEAAEKAVELAQERVDAFQSAYDAEIEARNNGYANSVATAKKELELEKRKQRDKQKELEKAQRNQARLDSITQASSLVTASAEIWSAFGKMPVLAIAAIAAMWSSFAAAKVKARQVTSQEYGEGGLEFLEGGSHASGHDIDLGTTNSRGKRMRAEGGEAMAIINKKNTRKYKTMLPDIIDSLNSGNFEEKYLSSLNTSGLAISVNNSTVDISRIEGDVADIKKQNETKYYVADGYLVIQHKNVKRIIKN